MTQCIKWMHALKSLCFVELPAAQAWQWNRINWFRSFAQFRVTFRYLVHTGKLSCSGKILQLIPLFSEALYNLLSRSARFSHRHKICQINIYRASYFLSLCLVLVTVLPTLPSPAEPKGYNVTHLHGNQAAITCEGHGRDFRIRREHRQNCDFRANCPKPDRPVFGIKRPRRRHGNRSVWRHLYGVNCACVPCHVV